MRGRLFMRELMLELLTYEPFEKINGDEKKYIDAVLDGNTTISKKYPLYDELVMAFEHFCKNKGDAKRLVSWFQNYYSLSTTGKIVVLTNKNTGERAYYPVLFKKICFYCITEYNLGDADFLKQFGIKPNILNKWEVSPRYRKIINKDTYNAVNISRNGKKQKYLTDVVKSAFYEASRQEADIRLFDPATKGWVAPKKENLLPFIDVFAGTGAVTASVDANESVVNDFDIGVACFLYCMSHNEKEVRTRLAQLHNNFVTTDLSNGAAHYSAVEWSVHKQKTQKYRNIIDPDFDILMIRLRNNFDEIYKRYDEALKTFVVNFVNPSEQDIQSYYDIGVAWFFLNAIKNKDVFTGGAYSVVVMDVDSYYSYLKNTLNVFGVNKKGVCKFQKTIDRFNGVIYKFIPNIKLGIGDIKFTAGKNYMKIIRYQFQIFYQIINLRFPYSAFLVCNKCFICLSRSTRLQHQTRGRCLQERAS